MCPYTGRSQVETFFSFGICASFFQSVLGSQPKRKAWFILILRL
jgi:hypothetical protein